MQSGLGCVSGSQRHLAGFADTKKLLRSAIIRLLLQPLEISTVNIFTQVQDMTVQYLGFSGTSHCVLVSCYPFSSDC